MIYLRIRTFAAWDEITTILDSTTEQVLDVKPDDNHAIGDDMFEIYGRTCKVKMINEGALQTWFDSVPDLIDPDIANVTYLRAPAPYTNYLNAIFFLIDDVDNQVIFTGLVSVQGVKRNELKTEIEIEIKDQLWVWINLAKEHYLDFPIAAAITMSKTDFTNPNTLAGLMHLPLTLDTGLSTALEQINHDYDLSKAIYFTGREYAITGYLNDYSTWSYSLHKYGHTYTFEQYDKKCRIDWIGDNHSATGIMQCTVLAIYLHYGQGLYAWKWVTFKVRANAIMQPYDINVGSEYHALATPGIPPLDLYVLLEYISDWCVQNGLLQYPAMALTNPYSTEKTWHLENAFNLSIDDVTRIYFDTVTSKFKYDAFASFQTIQVKAGKYDYASLVKGLLTVNNLTMYCDRTGHLRIVNRIPYWSDDVPLAISNDDLIEPIFEGVMFDMDNLLSAVDNFDGADNLKALLKEFYLSWLNKFRTIVRFGLTKEYYKLFHVYAGQINQQVVVTINGTQAFNFVGDIPVPLSELMSDGFAIDDIIQRDSDGTSATLYADYGWFGDLSELSAGESGKI